MKKINCSLFSAKEKKQTKYQSQNQPKVSPTHAPDEERNLTRDLFIPEIGARESRLAQD